MLENEIENDVDFEDFDLDEFLSKPTRQRSEAQAEPQTVEQSTSMSILEIDEEEEEEESEVEKVKPKVLSPYNAKENAEMLVNTLSIFNSALPRVAKWKLRKDLGGRKSVNQLRLAFEKKINKEEITEEEKKRATLYEMYLNDKKDLCESMEFSDDEKKDLIEAATKMCKDKQIEMSGSFGFWSQYTVLMGLRLGSIFIPR